MSMFPEINSTHKMLTQLIELTLYVLFRRNINIYLCFVSFLHIATMQVVEILPQIREEPTYST